MHLGRRRDGERNRCRSGWRALAPYPVRQGLTRGWLVGTVGPMLNTTLAKRRRRELGLTLEEVGDLCGVGRQAVWQWETGEHDPQGGARLKAYAAALEVSVEDLLAEPDPEVAATP